MENKEAIKLIDKTLKKIDEDGVNSEGVISNVKALRVFALEEQIPLVVKVLRLTYEHIEANDSFLIPILDDEPLEENGEIVANDMTAPEESLKYLLSLIKNLNNKMNVLDLKEYRDLLTDY
ncbi:hypothetical protein [uncultured Algibacter sp.]|uniref:hypothetical protein n=1 Tax=uncultured Algibacter sp. TaxID=298659 RepID=UPI002637999F|nr:hypothetical protein [uncultured Algibacter sp.]